MKFLLLCCDDEQEWSKVSKSDQQQHMNRIYHVLDAMKANGQYISSVRLQPTTSATCVRVRNGKMMVTDGPFAETREQLGGFFLIEAPNKEEAARIAARIPGSPRHTFEVRQVLEIPNLPAS